MDAQTELNVRAALQGEAFAHARYLLFAAAARKRGSNELAKLLEGIAEVELQEHFAELAALAGMGGTDVENIREAIRDENLESDWTYPKFADQARAVGDIEVAERFAEIAADEREHEKTLEQVLERAQVPA